MSKREQAEGIGRRALHAGGWQLAKRLIKPIPVVGSALALGLAASDIKKKGIVRGAVNVGLDVIPFVGTAKGVVELFTGDLIADKPPAKPKLDTESGR